MGSGVFTLAGSNTYRREHNDLRRCDRVEQATPPEQHRDRRRRQWPPVQHQQRRITTFNVGRVTGSGNIGLADGGYALTLSVGGNNANTTYSGVLGGGQFDQDRHWSLLQATTMAATTVLAGTLLAARPASLPGYRQPRWRRQWQSLVQTGNGTAGWSSSQVNSLLANATWTDNTSVLGIDTTAGDFTTAATLPRHCR